MKEVVPYGVKHFQVSEKRSFKNIKEILAPSTVTLSRPLTMNTNDNKETLGSHPCNKPCVYCKKFGHILENDEEMKEVVPYGVKHFQVSEKRSSKNIKEILAPSSVTLSRPLTMNTNDNKETLGSHPCNKPFVYCKLLSKTETNHITSVSTGQSYKIRQSIDGQSKDVIYVVKCVKCNLQGVGHSKKI